VARWLAAAGVGNGVLSAKGLGETRPVVPNTSAINRARNRRVEIRLEK
jgi:outer membrane protein OmpA-like peptidoglycan-associated protein